MQTYGPGIVKQKETKIFAPSPRSGHLSVYARKLSSQAFVWLCSIVVWGNVVNYMHVYAPMPTNARSGVEIFFALLIWVLISAILILNWISESSSALRNGVFSHGLEAQLTAFLIFLWLPVIISVSIAGDTPPVAPSLTPPVAPSPTPPVATSLTPPVATWFAWLGFFGTMYATLKAYHSFKEEDLPSDPPDAFDDEDYVYG